MLQHPPREVPGDRFDDVIRLAGLEQPRDDGVPQVVESQARQASRIAQRAPGRVPLARRLRRIELVMLARAPEVVLRFRVAELVGALRSSRLTASKRVVVQRDHSLARLVLALCECAAPRFSESTSLRRTCLTSTPRIDVFAASTAAQ